MMIIKYDDTGERADVSYKMFLCRHFIKSGYVTKCGLPIQHKM